MCHSLRHLHCHAWLAPQGPAVWDTLFASFQAFCKTCEQLSMASCAASAPDQEQAQQQEQAESREAGAPSDPVQSAASQVAMFNAIVGAKANRSSSSKQQSPPNLKGPDTAQPAGGNRETSSCRLLVLLRRCGEMEQLLAHLVPGLLALNLHETQQVPAARVE